MSRGVAIYRGLDTGGGGICNTPPTSLTGPSQAGRNVYVNKVPVIVAGDSLTSVPGTTPKGDPCVSSRRAVVVGGKVFANKKMIAKQGDVLNAQNNIRIAGGSQNVFL